MHADVLAIGVRVGVLAMLGCEAEAPRGEPPTCVEYDPAGCGLLYPAEYDEVFTRTLVPTCGTGGASCHGSADALGAAENGLLFDDADATFARLVEDRGDATFVVAGDAACSSLVVRLVIDDADLSMPPGAPLADGELCSVATWITDGAQR